MWAHHSTIYWSRPLIQLCQYWLLWLATDFHIKVSTWTFKWRCWRLNVGHFACALLMNNDFSWFPTNQLSYLNAINPPPPSWASSDNLHDFWWGFLLLSPMMFFCEWLPSQTFFVPCCQFCVAWCRILTTSELGHYQISSQVSWIIYAWPNAKIEEKNNNPLSGFFHCTHDLEIWAAGWILCNRLMFWSKEVLMFLKLLPTVLEPRLIITMPKKRKSKQFCFAGYMFFNVLNLNRVYTKIYWTCIQFISQNESI